MQAGYFVAVASHFEWLLLFQSTGSRCLGSVVAASEHSSCGTWVWCSLRLVGSSWSGMEPMSSALAGGFLTNRTTRKAPRFFKRNYQKTYVILLLCLLEWRKHFSPWLKIPDRTNEKIDGVYIKIKTSEWCPSPQNKKEKEEMERRKHKNRKKDDWKNIHITKSWSSYYRVIFVEVETNGQRYDHQF